MLLDQIQNSVHDLLMNFFEKVPLPFDQVQGVNIVDVFLTLVDLTLNPVAIQVAKEVVHVLGGGCVAVPLADVEAKQAFFSVAL